MCNSDEIHHKKKIFDEKSGLFYYHYRCHCNPEHEKWVYFLVPQQKHKKEVKKNGKDGKK